MKQSVRISGLSLLVAAVALVGCGSDDKKDSAAESTVAVTVVDDAPAADGGDTAEEVAAAEAAVDAALAPFADDPDIPDEMMACVRADLTDHALDMGAVTFTERFEAGEDDAEFLEILDQTLLGCGFT